MGAAHSSSRHALDALRSWALPYVLGSFLLLACTGNVVAFAPDTSRVPVWWPSAVRLSPLQANLMTMQASSTRKVQSKSKSIIKSGRKPARQSPVIAADTYEELAGQIAEETYKASAGHFQTLDGSPVLVLNADYSPLSYLPLSLWTWQDAIKAVFMDRVTVLATYNDHVVRSAHMEMRLPSVIALKEFVNQHDKQPSFTRRNLYLRDGYRCQYCARYFHAADLSFDHVMPRTRGGRTSWDNVVTCCHKCNSRKRDTHPKSIGAIGMKLLKAPKVPSFFELQSHAKKYPPRLIHETWEEYLFFERPLDVEGAEAFDRNAVVLDHGGLASNMV